MQSKFNISALGGSQGSQKIDSQKIDRLLTCCFRFWRSSNQEKVIALGKSSARFVYFHVFRPENTKQKIYGIVNHKNWIVDITWWDIEVMGASNINSDHFGQHADGKGKRFTLFCVFKINWNCWNS